MVNRDDIDRIREANKEAVRRGDKIKEDLVKLAKENSELLEKHGIKGPGPFPWGQANYVYVFSGNEKRENCVFCDGDLKLAFGYIYSTHKGRTAIYACDGECGEHVKYELPLNDKDLARVSESDKKRWAREKLMSDKPKDSYLG
jgi:hypothetical protein